MKWKTPKTPANGTVRFVKRFAFWPADTADGYTVWMGFVWHKQVYHTDFGFVTDEIYLNSPFEEKADKNER